VKTIVLGSASALNVGWLPATGTNRSKLTTGDISSIKSWNICENLNKWVIAKKQEKVFVTAFVWRVSGRGVDTHDNKRVARWRWQVECILHSLVSSATLAFLF
jgi:hypothetical protein